MGHLLGGSEPDEALLDTYTKLLKRCLSFLVNRFGLLQLLLPGLIEVGEQLFALVELLGNLRLGDLLRCAVGGSYSDELLLQGCSFRIDLIWWRPTGRRTSTSTCASCTIA